MKRPAKVDLFPEAWNDIDNQGSTPACGAYATASAMNILNYRAGITRVESPYFLWHWVRVMQGRENDPECGSTPKALIDALRLYGSAPLSDAGPKATSAQMRRLVHYKSIQAHEVRWRGTKTLTLKDLLCRGYPVIVSLRSYTSLENLKGDWRTESLWKQNWSDLEPGEHYATVLGYDDDYGVFKIENSWGIGWGDRGYFGLKYADLDSLVESALVVDLFYVPPVPVGDYEVPPPVLLTFDKAQGFDRIMLRVKADILELWSKEGLPAALSYAGRYNMADNEIEALFALPSDTLKSLKIQQPDLPWDGVVFNAA